MNVQISNKRLQNHSTFDRVGSSKTLSDTLKLLFAEVSFISDNRPQAWLSNALNFDTLQMDLASDRAELLDYLDSLFHT